MGNAVFSTIGLACAMLAGLSESGSRAAGADTVVTLGDQDFEDGASVTTGAFLAASVGEPAPFQAFLGSDPNGPDFAGTWTFTYAPLPAVSSASLALGIFDHDSAAAGNQVASFILDGLDLTAAMNTLFEAAGGVTSEYNVYVLSLPQAALPALSDGSAAFALTLQGPGLGVLGLTAFNGAGLDFSTLTVVPEPSSVVLLALASLAVTRRGRAKV